MVDTGYGLGRSLGDCRPALPKGRKVESTKWLKHKLRATIEQTDGRSGFPFPMRFDRGRLEFVTQVFGDSPKLSSSGLANTMTNLMFRICSFIQKMFLLAYGSVLVLSVQNSMFRSGWLTFKGVWPSFPVWSPPWLYASSVKNKQNMF